MNPTVRKRHQLNAKFNDAEWAQVLAVFDMEADAVKGPSAEMVRNHFLNIAAAKGKPDTLAVVAISELRAVRAIILSMLPRIVDGTLTVEDVREFAAAADASKERSAVRAWNDVLSKDGHA